jgi:hypothetical protein
MDPERDDHVLNVLRSFASGAELSVGLSITVLCGPARIQGVLAGSDAYTEHLGDVLSRAFRETAETAEEERVRDRAAHLAEVYATDRYVATNERRRARRREIAERLRAVNVAEDTADVADLEQEEHHLGELTPILILETHACGAQAPPPNRCRSSASPWPRSARGGSRRTSSPRHAGGAYARRKTFG